MGTSSRWLGTSGVVALTLTFALSATPSASGQGTPGTGPNEIPLMRSQFERWKERGGQIEAQVRAGAFKKADGAATGLLRDLTNKLTGGPDAGRILAMPLSLRALARVGLKREEDALWDYQMAAVLWPALERVRLSDYGPPGVRLAEIVAETHRGADAAQREASSGTTDAESPEIAGQVTPPAALTKEGIDFPASLSFAMKSGQAVIALLIDAEGRPHAPRIHGSSSQNAVFLYSAMDGVRTWRFRPATYQGKPVAVTYTLTVNYRLKG